MTKEWVVTQARSALEGYTLQARQTPENLKNVIRRVATMPGERQVLLVSDGFLPLEMRSLLGDAIDRALRAQVMISALDAKGLVVISRTADASRRYFPGIELAALYDLFDAARESAASGVLGEIADSTGGQFFHNNNDLDAGFQKVLASPEVIYTLTFSPQNLKYNGAFHSIKVELVNRNGLTVQARKGYFAPAGLLDRKKQAEEEIQQAAFSREEINELTLGVQTQFFKTSAEDARITVVAHLDASTLAFRDESGLHITSISFVTLLFDRDGNLITGNQKDVDLRLGDPALAHVRQSGITVKIPLKVKVGAYTVRVVARGSEGGQLAALSKPVEIPF
ncbi:MAG: VWA domain-containing protein [Acidobacteriia bacterium]|nr:VWA domain-containing protein [Terriglobia bacterium]